MVSNIEIEPPNEKGEITTSSNFVLGDLRRGVQAVYFARQIHRLRPTPQGLRLAYKKVMLLNNNEPIHNLSFIV